MANDAAATDAARQVALANAAATYMLSDAEADKNSAANRAGGVANWRQLYTDALADARLSLAKAQADADLDWIKGVAQANAGFQTTDAGNWEEMIDDEAVAANDFASMT